MGEVTIAAGAHTLRECLGQAATALDLGKLAQGKPVNVAIIGGTLLAIALIIAGYECSIVADSGRAELRLGLHVCSRDDPA